jgi:hypothetical protein
MVVAPEKLHPGGLMQNSLVLGLAIHRKLKTAGNTLPHKDFTPVTLWKMR